MMRQVLLVVCSTALVSAGIIGTDYLPATSVSYSSLSTPTVVKTVPSPEGYTKFLHGPPVYESILTTKESKFQTPDGAQHSTFSKTLNTAYSSVNKYETKSSKDGDILANTIPDIYSTSIHSPVAYHPHHGYTYSSPLIHTVGAPAITKSVSVPIAYTAHDAALTKSLVSPTITSFSTPVLSKTKVITSGLSTYSTTPVHHTVHKSVAFPVAFTSHELPLTKTLVAPAVTSYTTPVVLKNKILTSGLSSYPSHTSIIAAQPIKTTLTYSEAPIVSHMSFSGLGANYAW